jgi:hypothetical protein
MVSIERVSSIIAVSSPARISSSRAAGLMVAASRSITSRAVAIAAYETADRSVHDPSVKAIAACATRRQSCSMAKRWSRTHPHTRPSGFNSCGLDHVDLGVEPPFDAQYHADSAAEQTHGRCAAKEVDGALDSLVDLREELDQVRDGRSVRPTIRNLR